MTNPASDTQKNLVVFKVGGSLLDHPDLTGCLRSLSQLRPGCVPLLTVGGGGATDLVRKWQPLHGLSEEQAHWLAIDAIALNEALLQNLLPELRLVRSLSQLEVAEREGAWPLLCAACFLRWGESRGFEPLPRNWHVTSDSIAAWVAQIIGADELVLLKSCPLEPGLSLEEAAAAGVVDPQFPTIAQSLPRISWLNVRAEPLRIQPWTTTIPTPQAR